MSQRTEIVITLKDPGLKKEFVEKGEPVLVEEEKEEPQKEEETAMTGGTAEQVADKTESDKKIFTLERYVHKMLGENPTLGEQHYLVTSFKKDIEKAKGNFRPTVTLNSKYRYFELSKPDDQRDELSADVTVRYNLFNGYKDENEKDISKFAYQGSIYSREQVENELIYSVAEAYISLQKANEVFELSRKNYEDYIAWEEKSEIKFQNGLLSLKDFSKIQARSISRYMNFEEDTKRYIDRYHHYAEIS